MKAIIPLACVFLYDSSELCIVRDIALDCPGSQWGHITILGQEFSVRFPLMTTDALSWQIPIQSASRSSSE